MSRNHSAYSISDSIRTFIAFELPEKVRTLIGKIQEDLRSSGLKIRWVSPRNIHLTLKFLGQIPQRDILKIEPALLEVAQGFGPISISAKGIGVFPGFKRPRVLWVGVSGQVNQLIALQRAMDQKLAGIGFAKEKRAFKGHLTMGRIKERIDPKRLVQAADAFSEFESETFVVNEIILFKSELKPSGAVYSKLKTFFLV